MKTWKRCLAALLSFSILYTSTNIVNAAGTFYEKFLTWTASRAEMMAEYYGMPEKETAVLMNDAVNQGFVYTMTYPYPNEEKSKKNLVEVDYLNRYVYAKAYATSGYVWKPTMAIISANGEVQEEIVLTEGTCYFNQKEYNASGAFTYSENRYTAVVTYELWVDIDAEEQARILNIPKVLAQTAANTKELNAMRLDVKKLGEMSPYLNELLSLEFEVEETKIVETEDEEGNPVEVKEKIMIKEPALDPVTDAEIISAISAIYQEYTENNGMILHELAEEYNKDSSCVLTFTLAHGIEVRDKSSELFEYANILKLSTKLKKVLNKVNAVNNELYQQIQYLSSITTALVGSAKKPGPLRELQNAENWQILDETVQASIFKNGYSEKELADMEASVYALRNATVNVPAVSTEIILAATTTVSCDVIIYDVNISVSGKVVSGEVGNKELIDIESASTTLKLLAGTTVEDVEKAITECGIEEHTVAVWNGLNSNYLINPINYNRKTTAITKDLNQDVDYQISYEPKYFQVDTNFDGNKKLPFGYVLEFPMAGEEANASFEYNVETEDGSKRNLEEGATYRITKSVTITQVKGAVKEEHRLYDILIDDVQYGIDDNVKQIFQNSALNSPTVKFHTPDGKAVGEVVFENGVYSITAEIVNAGSGMRWIPYIATIYKIGDSEPEEVLFDENGVATWTTSDFTHVMVKYQLKIDKIKNGWITEDYSEEDVLNALNLPSALVEKVTTQNQLLNGDSGVTVKRLYVKLSDTDMKLMMSQAILNNLGASMTTIEGKNAVRILQGSERETIKDSKGKNLGYGAWDSANDQLALYTYMQNCADAGWSLASYYKNGYYSDIAVQAKKVGVCLVNISNDSGLVTYLSKMGLSDAESYQSKIKNLGEELIKLSEKLSGPPEELNINDENFPALIEYLISMKDQVSGFDSSNGVYKYKDIRRNGEKTGSMTVTVQIESVMKKSKEVEYPMEGSEHILTRDDVNKINQALIELRNDCGLTEEETLYYDTPEGIGIPQVGTVVGKYSSATEIYKPKKYTVTCEGIEDFEASFLYKSDYVIELPAYSENVDELDYYWYQVREGEEPIKVYNGSKPRPYRFSKEDLITLFDATGHLRISASIHQNISEWDIQPEVKFTEAKKAGVFNGYTFNHENGLLLIDASPKGISKADFNKYISFYTEASGKADISYTNTNINGSDQPLLGNGTIVTCISPDKNGEEKVTEIMIVLLGDVNKDGLVNEFDLQMLLDNFFGIAKENEVIGSKESILASDMNRNDEYFDSNDAFNIVMKELYWGNTSGKAYNSVL